jgi:hypothetical protein
VSTALRQFAAPLSSSTVVHLSALRADRAEAFEVQPESAQGRARIEAFIQTVYRIHYGAEIRHWAPSLVGLAKDESLIAAAGYRRATERLFLECYLPAPVEQVIAAKAGARASREAIFEVGHFASSRHGAGRGLLIALGRHLAAEGCRWVVSTATFELRALFDRIGVRVVELGPANAAVLGHEASSWGSYYEHAPIVIAGELDTGLAALRRST